MIGHLNRIAAGVLACSLFWFVDAASAQQVPPAAAICAPCHGFDGIGHDVEVPNIAGQHSAYLRNQLKAFKSGQRRHPEMRYITHKLTDREVEGLVNYYATLPPR
jgi:cytochrome c553